MALNAFAQIGIVFALATLGGYLSQMTKQPLIPAYILAGVVLGPITGIIADYTLIQTLSLTGIAFLLFIVGLEFNFPKLKDIGKVATIGGFLQVVILFSFGFLLASLLGYGGRETVYVGLILAFSSTLVVVKLLADKKEIDTLHGRVIIGILLMQDILAIVAISILSTIDSFSVAALGVSFVKAFGMILIAGLLSHYVFPTIFRYAARSLELLFLAAISVCFLFGIAFEAIGFTIAIGAFVAGVSIGNLPYRVEIIARIRPLKDFFATLFFASLGLGLILDNIGAIIVPLLLIALFCIVVKPLVIMFLAAFFGYAKRTSFLTAVSLGQISEFSLIMAAQGVVAGHLSQEIYTLSVFLAIITIAVTSYVIKFDNILYKAVSKHLHIFDLMNRGRHLQFLPSKEISYDIVLLGFDRIGFNIFSALQKMKKSYLVVDFNPDVVKRLVKRKIPCLYGDVGDPELLERINFSKAQYVISTIPHVEDNLLVLDEVRKVNKKGVVFVTANQVEEAMKLYKKGADYVILPHFLGGEHVSLLLQDLKGLKDTIKKKYNHIEELKRRQRLGHEHPINLHS